MTLLLAAVVSAVVSAIVAYGYDRLTSERRLAEALAKSEIEHDREMILELGRILRRHKEAYQSSERDEPSQTAFAKNLGTDFIPPLWEVSNRMIHRMTELNVWVLANHIAYEWIDGGATWQGQGTWFVEFRNDVDLMEDGLEELTGGESNLLRDRRNRNR